MKYPRLYTSDQPHVLYVRDENTAFHVHFNPLARGWPVSTIVEITGKKHVAKEIKDSLDPAEINEELELTDPEEMVQSMKDHSDLIGPWAEIYEKHIAKYNEKHKS